MIMEARTTAIALALFAASSAAFAGDFNVLDINHRPDFVEFTNVQSVKTPAETRVELQDAHAKGQTARTSPEFVEPARVAGKTRAEVRAELEAANAQGQLAHQPEFVEFTHVASTKSRDEVRQEMLRTANRSQ
jgi:antirestriction protein ArdC